MTGNKPAAYGGALVRITDGGWSGCSAEELARRRERFMETAAELCGSLKTRGKTSRTDSTVPQGQVR